MILRMLGAIGSKQYVLRGSKIMDVQIFNRLTKDWLNEKSLHVQYVDENHMLSLSNQNVIQFKSILMNIANETKNNIIACAFDGINYRIFHEVCKSFFSVIKPTTTVIPSTSMTAWTSVFHGTPPEEHGVYGTAFYVEAEDKTVSLLSRKLEEEPLKNEKRVFSWIPEDIPSTFLYELSKKGYINNFMGLGDELITLSFWNQLANGATLTSLPDAQKIEYKPIENAKALLHQVTQVATQKIEDHVKFCDVAFFNSVCYISENGYTNELKDAIRLLMNGLLLLKSKHNLTVLVIADHGMVRQYAPKMISLIHDKQIFNLSRYKQGGAGRILFFYPRSDSYQEMLKILQERLGLSGKIYSREEYIQEFYPSKRICNPNRIGDIVAVASTQDFPSAGITDLYEHGGLHQEEMISFSGIL